MNGRLKLTEGPACQTENGISMIIQKPVSSLSPLQTETVVFRLIFSTFVIYVTNLFTFVFDLYEEFTFDILYLK